MKAHRRPETPAQGVNCLVPEEMPSEFGNQRAAKANDLRHERPRDRAKYDLRDSAVVQQYLGVLFELIYCIPFRLIR